MYGNINSHVVLSIVDQMRIVIILLNHHILSSLMLLVLRHRLEQEDSPGSFHDPIRHLPLLCLVAELRR